jgi:hypothetical protein
MPAVKGGVDVLCSVLELIVDESEVVNELNPFSIDVATGGSVKLIVETEDDVVSLVILKVCE